MNQLTRAGNSPVHSAVLLQVSDPHELASAVGAYVPLLFRRVRRLHRRWRLVRPHVFTQTDGPRRCELAYRARVPTKGETKYDVFCTDFRFLCWRSGSVFMTSVFGWRTFPDL